MKGKTTTPIINGKVTAVIPETEEYIEHTIIIAKMEDGLSLFAAGQTVWLPSYAIKEVFKQVNLLNNQSYESNPQ